MRNVCLLVVASLAGTLLGCGQKGPLVLPDAQHPHKKIVIPKPPVSTPATSGHATPAAPPATASPEATSPAPGPATVPPSQPAPPP